MCICVDGLVRSIEHEDDVQLHIPEIAELSNNEITDEEIASNKEIISLLEEAVVSWEKQITKVTEIQLAKVSLKLRFYTFNY